MRPKRHRGSTEIAGDNLSYLASHARIAIHASEFSHGEERNFRGTAENVAVPAQ
jgi:hypothetical protein